MKNAQREPALQVILGGGASTHSLRLPDSPGTPRDHRVCATSVPGQAGNSATAGNRVSPLGPANSHFRRSRDGLGGQDR